MGANSSEFGWVLKFRFRIDIFHVASALEFQRAALSG